MIDAPTATLIASALATVVAIVGFAAVVYFRLGRLEGKLEGLEEKIDLGLAANRELTLSESRRLSEKIDSDIARLSDKMDSGLARLSDKMDAQHSETMAAIQRLTDAFLSHWHDDDGNVAFRIPPGTGPD